MTQKDLSISHGSAKLLWFTLRGDFQALKEYIEGDTFKRQNQEILLAVRIALQRNENEIVKYFDEMFNMAIKDVKVIGLAAEANLKIWKLFEEKPTTWQVKYNKHNHPLVVASRSGNYDVAKSLRMWIKKHPDVVPETIVDHSVYEAAEMGHVEICKLYTISDSYMSLVISALVRNGHANKVKCIVRTPTTDFSYNNFEMLRTCDAHFDAMCAILRHPSVDSKIDQLEDYFKFARAACYGDWKIRQKSHLDGLTKVLQEKISQKKIQGVDEATSIIASQGEMANRIKAHLVEHDLESFVYNFKN